MTPPDPRTTIVPNTRQLEATPPRTADYVIVSPVRNEADYLGETIRSIVGQTVRPARWVIVDDGSEDETAAIVEIAARHHDWIRLVRRERRSERRVGGGVVDAFKLGLETIRDLDYAFLCKLDGDLRIGRTYFERLLDHFDRDPRLGTLSGKCYLVDGERLMLERTNDDFSLGAAKFYRRACYEEIGGFVSEVMWDGIDCHRCRMRGWKAASIDDPELVIQHLRRMGSSHKSVFHGRIRHGRGQYFMGTHPLYMAVSGFYRMREVPVIAGGVLMIWGYFLAALRGVKRYEDPEFRRHLRRWQLKRLIPRRRRRKRKR